MRPLTVPEDVAAFYELCAGMVIGSADGPAWRVVPPDQLVPAARRLLAPDDAEQVLNEMPGDPVSTTVVFADQGGQHTDEHVLLDLSPARLDRFYAAFWDTFGVAGSMPVVAHSVAGALMWLLGEQVTSSGDVLGDAYD